MSSQRTYTKNNLIDVEEFSIEVTVKNGHKIKCKLKGTLNMKLQGGDKVKL